MFANERYGTRTPNEREHRVIQLVAQGLKNKEVAEEICAKAGLSDDEIYKFIRGNAIKGFGLERFGITK